MKPVEFDTRVLANGILRLPSDVAQALTADTAVHVVLTPAARDPEAMRKRLEATFGAWKDDPSITSIFEVVERGRQSDLGRAVELP